MKCRICDRPTAGTVKLCADCTKALMRARGASAALYKDKASKPHAVRIEPAGSHTAVAPPPAWRRLAWAAAGLAAIVAFYVSQVEPNRRPASVGAVADSSSMPFVERLHRHVSPMAVPASESSATGDVAGAPAAAPTTSEFAAATTSLPNAATVTPAGAKAPPRTGTTSTPVSAPAIDRAANKSKAPPADREASQLLARTEGGQTASSADVDQVPANASDKCGSEGPLARFVCEQKLYLQYCENKWDKDPRCMRRTGSN